MESTDLDSAVTAAQEMVRRIFVPIDYSLDSHRALGLAIELHRKYGSAICVYHAAESTPSDDWQGGIGSSTVQGDWVNESEARLHRFLENVAPDFKSHIEVRARVGQPLRTIHEEMHAWGATMLIAVANVHAAILRSPAEQLVRDIDVPALILPATPPASSKPR